MSFAYHYELYDEAHEGVIKTVKGVLSIDGEELLFEYKLYDMMDTVISTLNKFSLNVDYLKKVMYKRGIFQSKMIIEATRFVFLEPIPGSQQGKITLKIARSDRDQAQEFATKLNIALTERRLRDMDSSEQ